MNPVLRSDLRNDRRAKRTLLLIALAVVAPVAVSYLVYYAMPRRTFTNYGELLATRPIAAVSGTRLDGSAFSLDELRGKWAILFAADGGCTDDCARALYATRQGRTMQGPAAERVVRVWLVTDGAQPSASALAEHPGIVAARISPSVVDALPKGRDAIYLVDPLGNQVLAWPRDPDIKALSSDLARLLKASRIG